MDVTELRAGRTFQLDGAPYQVLKYTHSKLGRGGATIRVSVRNLRSGSVEEKTFNSGAVVEPANTSKRKLQYLYSDATNAVFMDPQTYEQVEINKKILAAQASFLKEGEEISVLFWGEQALDVDLPPKVTLSVVETPPGVKGDSATNIYKPATLDNGLQIKVPLFVNSGDKVVVDTRTGEYVERAK